jgi:hypothetical protein
MLAYCGLDCSACPIRLATQETDPERQRSMRQGIVADIQRLYAMTCTVEDITDCDGCRSDTGRLFAACAGCGVRQCARERHLENCAHCSEYVCRTLQGFFDHGGKLLHMDARKRLDEIRETLD